MEAQSESTKDTNYKVVIVHGEACMFTESMCDECRKKHEEEKYLQAKKIVDSYEEKNKLKPKQLKAVYLECHHGIKKNSFISCEKCEREKQEIYGGLGFRLKEIEKDKRIPILRGCSVGVGGQCYCTGKCKDIIGYYE